MTRIRFIKEEVIAKRLCTLRLLLVIIMMTNNNNNYKKEAFEYFSVIFKR